MRNFGIIADDLTGAMDSGAQFAKMGLRTVVHLSTDFPGNAGVVAVDTESREDRPRLACEKVREAARRLSGRLIYKKIDSTLRGNIGYELDAVMDELGLKKALIAPAFPANGRSTLEGQQLVDGVALLESTFSDDPLCPKTDHIPTLLGGQSRRSVGHIPLVIVDQGLRALLKEVESREEELLVVDALHEVHLRCTAMVAAQLGNSCLTCGSAGLAESLPTGFGLQTQELTSRSRPTVAPALVVAGSRHLATARQIERAVSQMGTALVEIDARLSEAEMDRALAKANQLLGRGKDVIVTTAFQPYVPERSQAVARGLGDLSAAITKHSSLSGLVLTGGSVAFSACRALRVVAIEVLKEVAPGLPAGVMRLVEETGTRLVTKAGGFGEDDALVRAISYLRGEHV